MTSHRDWIDLLEALGPLAAVGVAWYIGITQERLQKQQLKQDLFEKRMAVYQGVQNYVISLLRDESVNDRFAAYRQFHLETSPGEFLFDAGVWEYIELIGDIGTRFRTAQVQIEAKRITLQTANRVLNVDAAEKRRIEESASKYESAITEHGELQQLLVQAFEKGIKETFRKDLNLTRAD